MPPRLLQVRPRSLCTLVAALVVASGAAACTGGGGDEPAAGDAEASLEEVSVELVAGHALVGRLTVRTDGAAVPEITVTGEEGSFEVPVDGPAEELELPVAGLRAESDYEVEVVVGDDVEVLDLRTGALPEGLPPLEATVSEPEQMAPGVTLFNLLDNAPPDPATVAEGDESLLGWLVAVDAEGEVVWYHRAEQPMGDVRMVDDGLLLVERSDMGAQLIDLFGEVHQTWAGELGTGPLATDGYGRSRFPDDATLVATDSMHHEVSMLPSGNLLFLSSEMRTYDGFDAPRCGEDPATFDGTYDLIVDVVVEATPDGEVVQEWPLADVLDPVDGPVGDQQVCGVPIPGVFPTWVYQALPEPQGSPTASDWTHANGVVLDEEHNALIVSVRHVDAVLALRYREDEDGPAGEVLWRLGADGGLDLAEGGDWPYHQHAPELQEDGTLVLYDNGNQRPGTDLTTPPGTEPGYSRAVRYDISDLWDGGDEVVQVWEHRSEVDGEPAYASFVGDADVQPNGTVLVVDGGLAGANGGPSAQITEVVPEGDAGGEVVFELRVDGGSTWFVYRAERLPTLYG